MKIFKVKIQNFRGIQNLDWNLNTGDNLICLLGHGDSCKSSILKAIEYVLAPKWNLPLEDTDFYDCNPANEIKIEVTIGDLSDQLREDLVANYRYFKDGEFRNLETKEEDDELVVTACLYVGADLDPFWGIVDSDGNIDEDDRLSISTRKLFNLVRLDREAKNNFHWKYDSPLLKAISKERRKEIKSKLVEIGRNAREGFEKEQLPQEIKDQAHEIEAIASSLAVGHDGFLPNVDIFSADAICLHKGTIPLYMLGDGSKKIASLAIGKYLMKKSSEEDQEGGFLIFDEIENSLEPHRLRYILSSFVKESKESRFQTFLITHSSITIEELGTKEGLYVVRDEGKGEIKVHRISTDCIAAVRANSEALFSKKIIICEGKTEFGILKAFGRFWSHEDLHKKPPEHLGAAILDGKGCNMSKYMEKFQQMKYELCVYKDNDSDDPKISNEAKRLGISVFEYPSSFRTEKIVFSEAPKTLKDSLIELFNLNRIDSENIFELQDSYDQRQIDYIEKKFHDVLRKTPEGYVKGMFRNIDNAQELGEMIIKYWDGFESTSGFKGTIINLEKWIYG